MPSFLFPAGAPIPGGAYVIVKVQPAPEQSALDGALIAEYLGSSQPEGFAIDWNPISICTDSRGRIWVAGPIGEVQMIEGDTCHREVIGSREAGPAKEGPIRRVTSLGETLYAVGMGRQVYQREQQGWRLHDPEVLASPDEKTAGFNGIAATSDGSLIAAGFGGELWEFEHSWRRLPSPTNLLLTNVIAVGQNAFVSGLLGTLLVGRGDHWRLIRDPGFEHDIWDLVFFRDRLYLGTGEGLFYLESDDLIREVPGFPEREKATWLGAAAGRLWTFGGSRVYSTADGLSWQAETVFSTS